MRNSLNCYFLAMTALFGAAKFFPLSVLADPSQPSLEMRVDELEKNQRRIMNMFAIPTEDSMKEAEALAGAVKAGRLED